MATDRQLLSWLHGRHNDSALAELISRYGVMVMRTALRITGSERGAEDAGQAVFLLVVSRAKRLAGVRCLGDWLYRAATAAAGNWLSGQSRRVRAAAQDPESRERTATRLPPGFDPALAGLFITDREAVIVRHLCGMNHRDAASVSGRAAPRLDARASRGLVRLRKRLSGPGGALSLSALTGMLAAEGTAARSELPTHQARAIVSAVLGETRASVEVLSRETGRAMLLARFKLIACAVVVAVICLAATAGTYLLATG